VIVLIFPIDPSKDFIKRVIGTEGEKVEIIRNKIYVNDRLTDDPSGRFVREGELEYFQTMETFSPVIAPKIFYRFWEITATTVKTAVSGDSFVQTSSREKLLSSTFSAGENFKPAG
jgi:signal peptidase I